jgi:hypothetical protein
VAVGSAGGRAAVWRSIDGATWEPQTSLPEGDGAELLDVETDGSTLVATGRSAAGTAIWASRDGGRTWLAAGPPAALVGATIHDVSVFDGGWLAVGGAITARGVRGAAWTSADGRTWDLSLPESPEGWFPVLRSVTRLRDGAWLAVSGVESTDAPYVSRDGRSWTGSSPNLSGTNAYRGVVVHGPRLIGIPRRGTIPWWSDDGSSWMEAAMPGSLTGSLEAVMVLGDEIVIVGGGRGGPLLLRSTDGMTYTADVLDARPVAATAYDGASLEGIEVVVGIRDGIGAIWVRRR